MNKITTPEECFNNLPDYNFEPNYLTVGDNLRMHYVDEGDKNNPLILLLHGEPSWSFLYRKMIPILVKNGFRTIAPDLIGFGKSDKPIDKKEYSYQSHMNWLTEFIEKLDLNNIVLFCQDWGGLLGLRIITQMQDRFSHVIASNTALPIGNIPMPESFMQWREYSQHSESFEAGKVLQMASITKLPEEVIAAYNAPFPSEEYKAGSRQFPTLVPITEDDPESIKNKKAWEVLVKWEKPFLTIFGDSDPIMFGVEKHMQKLIPGTANQKHTILNAGHFIQEEKGKELAELVTEFYNDNK